MEHSTPNGADQAKFAISVPKVYSESCLNCNRSLIISFGDATFMELLQDSITLFLWLRSFSAPPFLWRSRKRDKKLSLTCNQQTPLMLHCNIEVVSFSICKTQIVHSSSMHSRESSSFVVATTSWSRLLFLRGGSINRLDFRRNGKLYERTNCTIDSTLGPIHSYRE